MGLQTLTTGPGEARSPDDRRDGAVRVPKTPRGAAVLRRATRLQDGYRLRVIVNPSPGKDMFTHSAYAIAFQPSWSVRHSR